MSFGVISYTEEGAVAIDSVIRGFYLKAVETYSANVFINGVAYKHTGWEIPKSKDEVLVLAESTHLVAVRDFDPEAGILSVGCLEDYQPRDPRERKPSATAAEIKVYRFSSLPPDKEGFFNIYTPDGHLAFTAAQPMLRPFGYFPVPDKGMQASFDNYPVEWRPPENVRLGVMLDASVRRFRYRSYWDGAVSEVAEANIACYKVTPRYICRRLVTRNYNEKVNWGGKAEYLFPNNQMFMPLEGMLFYL